MREVSPGICKWLEFIYPTDSSTAVFYRGKIIESRAGGQQGCPLMMACHCVVQRLMFESLGVVAPLAGSSINMPILSPPADLDLCSGFADDGFLAGRSAEFLRALRHLKSVMPNLGLQFSSLVVGAAAGEDGQIDFRDFVSEECSVTTSEAEFEILKSRVGSQKFCEEFCEQTGIKKGKIAECIGAIKDPQVAYYLLRWSCNTSRMNYLARTTPFDICKGGLQKFDEAVREAFGTCTALPLTSQQQMQASFKVKSG